LFFFFFFFDWFVGLLFGEEACAFDMNVIEILVDYFSSFSKYKLLGRYFASLPTTPLLKTIECEAVWHYGKKEEAMKELEKISHPRAKLLLSSFSLAQGEGRKAIAWAEKVKEEFPFASTMNIAKSLAFLNEGEEALRVLNATSFPLEEGEEGKEDNIGIPIYSSKTKPKNGILHPDQARQKEILGKWNSMGEHPTLSTAIGHAMDYKRGKWEREGIKVIIEIWTKTGGWEETMEVHDAAFSRQKDKKAQVSPFVARCFHRAACDIKAFHLWEELKKSGDKMKGTEWSDFAGLAIIAGRLGKEREAKHLSLESIRCEWNVSAVESLLSVLSKEGDISRTLIRCEEVLKHMEGKYGVKKMNTQTKRALFNLVFQVGGVEKVLDEYGILRKEGKLEKEEVMRVLLEAKRSGVKRKMDKIEESVVIEM